MFFNLYRVSYPWVKSIGICKVCNLSKLWGLVYDDLPRILGLVSDILKIVSSTNREVKIIIIIIGKFKLVLYLPKNVWINIVIERFFFGIRVIKAMGVSCCMSFNFQHDDHLVQFVLGRNYVFHVTVINQFVKIHSDFILLGFYQTMNSNGWLRTTRKRTLQYFKCNWTVLTLLDFCQTIDYAYLILISFIARKNCNNLTICHYYWNKTQYLCIY